MANLKTTLENELNQAKLNIKIYNALQVILEAFDKKKSYSFIIPHGKRVNKELFSEDQQIIRFFKLSLTSEDVTHFEDIYKIWYDKKPVFTKKVKICFKNI